MNGEDLVMFIITGTFVVAFVYFFLILPIYSVARGMIMDRRYLKRTGESRCTLNETTWRDGYYQSHNGRCWIRYPYTSTQQLNIITVHQRNQP